MLVWAGGAEGLREAATRENRPLGGGASGFGLIEKRMVREKFFFIVAADKILAIKRRR
jgi:hypothetical protein